MTEKSEHPFTDYPKQTKKTYAHSQLLGLEFLFQAW